MADDPKQEPSAIEKRKNFNMLYFWGMVIALFAILAIYYVFAFTNQTRLGHGQADPTKQSRLVRPERGSARPYRATARVA